MSESNQTAGVQGQYDPSALTAPDPQSPHLSLGVRRRTCSFRWTLIQLLAEALRRRWIKRKIALRTTALSPKTTRTGLALNWSSNKGVSSDEAGFCGVAGTPERRPAAHMGSSALSSLFSCALLPCLRIRTP